MIRSLNTHPLIVISWNAENTDPSRWKDKKIGLSQLSSLLYQSKTRAAFYSLVFAVYILVVM